jgi:hypothetical protein
MINFEEGEGNDAPNAAETVYLRCLKWVVNLELSHHSC